MKIALHCNPPGSPVDPSIAYEATLALENVLQVAGFTVQRFLPTGHRETYNQQLKLHDEDTVLSIFVKCRPTTSRGRIGKRSVRLTPLLKSSSFDTSGFAAECFKQLEFYCPGSSWVTYSNQSDYYLLKRGCIPITLDLGIFESVSDVKSIAEQFPKVLHALDLAINIHFENHI